MQQATNRIERQIDWKKEEQKVIMEEQNINLKSPFYIIKMSSSVSKEFFETNYDMPLKTVQNSNMTDKML